MNQRWIKELNETKKIIEDLLQSKNTQGMSVSNLQTLLEKILAVLINVDLISKGQKPIKPPPTSDILGLFTDSPKSSESSPSLTPKSEKKEPDPSLSVFNDLFGGVTLTNTRHSFDFDDSPSAIPKSVISDNSNRRRSSSFGVTNESFSPDFLFEEDSSDEENELEEKKKLKKSVFR